MSGLIFLYTQYPLYRNPYKIVPMLKYQPWTSAFAGMYSSLFAKAWIQKYFCCCLNSSYNLVVRLF